MLRRALRDPEVVWAAAFQVAFIASVTVFKVSTNALLIARSKSDQLPLLYFLSALTTGAVAAFSGRFSTRERTAPPVRALPAAAAVALLAFALLPQLGPVALPALYLAAEAYATLIALRFWEAMGNTFNARQARQTFTLLGAAGMVGSVLGGGLSALLSPVGVSFLLPVGSSLALLAAAASLGFGQAVARARSAATPRPRPAGTRLTVPPADGWRYVFGDPYPAGLALCAIALAALTAVVDYHFRRRAGAALDERQLASLFGWLNLAVGVFAVAVQTTISQRILTRFGIFRYLMVPPLGVAASAGLAFLLPGLWPVFVEKTLENAGSFSITQSGFQLLYTPIPPERSAAARGVIDGFLKKFGFALGGLLLLMLGTHSSDGVLTALVLAAALGCVLALAAQKPRYVRALAASLNRDPRQPAARVLHGQLDADARGLLRQELSSAEPHRVLNALEILRQDGAFQVRPFLAALLDHPQERVRTAAVRLAGEQRATELAEKLVQIAESVGDRPRDEAVRTLAVVLPEAEAVRRLRHFLTSPDVALRAAATEALYRLGGPSRGEAEAALEATLVASERVERRHAAQLLGRLRPAGAAQRLRPFLFDDDPEVRIAACHAASELRDASLIEPLFDLLPPRATRRAAREALMAYDDACLELAEARLNDRTQPLQLRLEMPKLLRGMGTARAAEILLFSNVDDDAFLRYRIGSALARWRTQNPTLPVDQVRVREAIHRRLSGYRSHAPIARDVEAELGPRALLTRALIGRLEQNQELVFQLLGLIYPQRLMLTSWRRFAHGDPRERAQAVELVDSVLDDELRADVLPILELDLARRTNDGRTRVYGGHPEYLAPRLTQLIESDDTLLQALARAALPRAAGRRGSGDGGHAGGTREVTVGTFGLETVLLLEGVDIFAGCSVDDLTALAQIASERAFKEGEPVYVEGEPGETLFVLVAGRVKVLKKGIVVLRLGPHEAFGSVSLLDGAPRPADAVAETAVRALAIDRADFLDLVADRPELLKGVFTVVTGQLREMIDVAARANLSAA